MANPTSTDWSAVRRRYEETDSAVADICADAGVTRRDLDTHRKRDRWRRQKPRGLPPGRKAAGGPRPGQPPVPSPTTTQSRRETRPRRLSNPLAERRRLVEHLVTAISTKLEQLERRMEQDLNAPGAAASSTDHERETRAIGALIDNLGKVTEVATDIERTATGRQRAGATELAGEADRFRRELAERLARLVKPAAGKS